MSESANMLVFGRNLILKLHNNTVGLNQEQPFIFLRKYKPVDVHLNVVFLTFSLDETKPLLSLVAEFLQ